MSIAELRKEYRLAALGEQDVDADPIVQFQRWFHEAQEAKVVEPNAMTLATCTPDAYPSARMVLLKGVDARGFVFFTDYRSRKGPELTDNPHAALVFWWHELERQVRVVGAVQRITRDESVAYFTSRPYGARVGAWVSHQSSVLPDRDSLDRKVEEMMERFRSGEVPLPDHWGGFRVVPEEFEFWQGRESRLHDRIAYAREGGRWVRRRLSP
ncbi:MAG TPA: pyridoxamine 5'-phosphate oxidase [Gemmatimonadaceae bacterium]|nr:pyridoxamine 5'-phosphate oxidase [Gemmatimonadaceae bacterium]